MAGLAALVALTGCASTAATAQPRHTPTPRSATGATAATDAPAAAGLPQPCQLVDATDVSLMVAMDDWQFSGSTAADHTVCAFRGRGVTVTAVVSLLGADGRPPAGVCAPPGSTALLAGPAEVCRYSGPAPDSTTVVVTGHGLAIGVRVVGRESARGAAALAAHSLTHL
jgi:hypothetical protein